MKEPTLFDFPTFSTDKKIRLIELFGGIGSQAMALEELGIDFETYKLVEFDKYAIKSYNAIHNTNFEVMDIRNVHGKDLEIRERERFTYIMTYSFPCTDLSVAGRMKGMSKEDWENGNSTRSGLLWEVERILKELPEEELPDVLLMENVPQVHADKNEIDFNNWLAFLRGKGYQNYYQDLNAKDFGIPQNRERTFCVSILSDDYLEFEFPEVMKLNYAMRDFLEEEVDEKYYVNSEKAKELISKLIIDGTLPTEGGGVSQLSADRENGCRSCENTMCERLQGIRHGLGHNERCLSKKNDQLNYVGNIRGGADTTRICGECLPEQRTFPDNSCKRLQSPVIDNKSVILGIIDPEGYDKENRVYSGGGCCPTLLVGNGRVKVAVQVDDWRIRKLTPKECYRLMGYHDEAYEKASEVNSGTQLYKQAGNAIVKQVLMAIFLQMGLQNKKKWNDMTAEERQELIKGSILKG